MIEALVTGPHDRDAVTPQGCDQCDPFIPQQIVFGGSDIGRRQARDVT